MLRIRLLGDFEVHHDAERLATLQSLRVQSLLAYFLCTVTRPNFMADEAQDHVRAAYGPECYDRLAALKSRYDPTNFFRYNQNIVPQPSGGAISSVREREPSASVSDTRGGDTMVMERGDG